jgi:hypothetical protein
VVDVADRVDDVAVRIAQRAARATAGRGPLVQTDNEERMVWRQDGNTVYDNQD